MAGRRVRRADAPRRRAAGRRSARRSSPSIVAATLVSALGEAGYCFLLGCGRLRPLALVTATASWVYPRFPPGDLEHGRADRRCAPRSRGRRPRASGRLAYLGQSTPRARRCSRPEPGLLVEAVRFGSRAWVGSLARFLNFRTDQILMGFLASEAALGVYAVAVNASEVLLYLPAAMATALLPAAARAEAGLRAEQALRAFRSAALVTAAAALVAALARPDAAARSSSARRSTRRSRRSSGSCPARSASPRWSSSPTRSSRTRRRARPPSARSCRSSSASALDLVLIPRFGASGAAAAASAAFLAGGCTALLVFRRRSPFAWRALCAARRSDLAVFRALARPLRAARSS